MFQHPFPRTRLSLGLVLLSALTLSSGLQAAAWKEKILHSFQGDPDGAEPIGPLTPDGHGNFYGTTDIGGLGYGTVFKLSPDGSGGWTETIIHSFKDYLDGGYPFFTTLIFDSKGNFYGTTTGGGPNGHGLVFEFSPVGKHWKETVLYKTGGDSGCGDPWGGVIMDRKGNFYGMCLVSGFPQTEAIFQLSQSHGTWKQKVIYNYHSAADNNGAGGLTMDAHGNIFAMLSAAYDAPALVELSPNPDGGWTPTLIHVFGKRIFPESVPVLDKAGNVYGTTEAGGAYDAGTVYEFTLGANKKWAEKILYSFPSCQDGCSPFGGIVFDASGNIYGTTAAGGNSNAGSVFELSPDGHGGYQQTTLWLFNTKDGYQALNSLTLDSTGNLYGVTPYGDGGSCNSHNGCGLAFELSRGMQVH